MKRFKALIVDDEYAARETLCRLVNWDNFGFEPPLSAVNGKQALELFRQHSPDLVFTDIEMPVMNGIRLIEEIRREKPGQRIVVISCHEKFEYARQALKLGVEDYLIKDLLTVKELGAFLSSYTLRDVEAQQAAAVEDELCVLLREAVAGGAVRVDGPACFEALCVLAVGLDDHNQLLLELGAEEVDTRVSRFWQRAGAPAHYYAGKDTIYMAFAVDPNNSMLYYYNNVITVSNKVRAAAKGSGFASVSIGVSNLCLAPEALPRACTQAHEALQMRMMLGQGRTTIFDTIALRKSALDYRQIEYMLGCIEEYAYHSNTACLHLIDKLYAISLQGSFADINYYRFINGRLWSLVLAVAQSQGREHTAVLSSIGADIEEVNRMENSAQMAGFFKSMLINLFAEDEKPENDNLVNRALRLVEREYMNDLSLGDIAAALHTNKSYLSRIFKEHTGENLMNMIMRKKIRRAEYLLQNTTMKLYEISDSLSFASPQYFSTVFKRYSGFSPGEYKKSLEQRAPAHKLAPAGD